MSLYQMQHILESIGLAEKEAAVYLANLRLGTNPASVISKEAGIQRSTTYSIIEKLKKRGFVMELKKGSLRSYTAVEPRRILNYLRCQQSELGTKIAELVDNLAFFDGLKTIYHSRPAVNLLEGRNGVIYIYENMLAEAKTIKSILSASSMDERLKKFFHSFNERRICKKIPIKIIARENALGEMPELIKKDLCELRFIEKDFAPNITINIYGDKTAIISIKEEFAILIENSVAAEAFSRFFDLAWSASSKKDPRFSGK